MHTDFNIMCVYLGNAKAIFQSFANDALLLFRAFENKGAMSSGRIPSSHGASQKKTFFPFSMVTTEVAAKSSMS
jgi:hypothetical protein